MKTVLVVDDSTIIRKAIRRILEPMGFQVAEADNGLRALDHVRGGAATDVVLLDIEMPEMDGLEFLRTLRGNKALPQPPVVMCTTHNSMNKIMEAMEAGANEFIMKPFDAGIIGAKLEGVGVR